MQVLSRFPLLIPFYRRRIHWLQRYLHHKTKSPTSHTAHHLLVPSVRLHLHRSTHCQNSRLALHHYCSLHYSPQFICHCHADDRSHSFCILQNRSSPPSMSNRTNSTKSEVSKKIARPMSSPAFIVVPAFAFKQNSTKLSLFFISFQVKSIVIISVSSIQAGSFV